MGKYSEFVADVARQEARAAANQDLNPVLKWIAGKHGKFKVNKSGFLANGFKAPFEGMAHVGGAGATPFKKIGKAGKIAAIGGVVLGGLAYIASAGRSKVTPDSVQNDMLEPEQMGSITPVVEAEPLLPPLAGQSNETIMGQPPQEGEWVSRMRGGSDEMEKRASVPTPSIAEDMRAEAIRAQKASSDQNLGMGA